MDNLQPPTDNLYKFLAIGMLAFALVACVIWWRALSSEREKWRDAQVELLSGGYQEGSGIPSDSALRQAYFRREYALKEGRGLLSPVLGIVIYTAVGAFLISATAFIFWWRKVQRYEDEILRITAEKMRRENERRDDRS
jgi:hypothetical protein